MAWLAVFRRERLREGGTRGLRPVEGVHRVAARRAAAAREQGDRCDGDKSVDELHLEITPWKGRPDMEFSRNFISLRGFILIAARAAFVKRFLPRADANRAWHIFIK
jgi:hypothetical protein